MTLQEEGQKIFWLVRGLVFLGALMILIGLVDIEWTFNTIRKDRLQTLQESRGLDQVLMTIRQLAGESREELLSILEGEPLPDKPGDFTTHLKSFAQHQADTSRLDSSVGPWNTLKRQSDDAFQLYQQILACRQAEDKIDEDLKYHVTLNKIRARIGKLREILESAEGRAHLEEIVARKKSQKQPRQEAAQTEDFSARIHLIEIDLLELSNGVEKLHGESSLDNLPDLLDNQIRSCIDRIGNAFQALSSQKQYSTLLPDQSVEQLRGLIIGHTEAPLSDENQSLFVLQKRHLELVKKRGALDRNVDDLFDEMGQTIDDLRILQQAQGEALATKIERSLDRSRWEALLISLISFIIFAWVAWKVMHYIKKQIVILDSARLEAQKSHASIQALLEEQRSASKKLAEAHQQAKQNELRFRQLSESAPMGILELSPSGICLYVNSSWTGITGLSLEESRQDGWKSIVHSLDQIAFSPWKRIVDVKGIFSMEVRFIRKDSDPSVPENIRWGQAKILPIRDENGSTTGYVGTIDDVTDAKKEEERKLFMEINLRHTQKMESIGQLASGIAHEINTPMQFISDNTHFVDESFVIWIKTYQKLKDLLVKTGSKANDPELTTEINAAIQNKKIDFMTVEITKATQQTLEGIERVTKIVHAMKDFSHPGQHEKIPVDLNQCIDNTISVARNEWKYISEVVTDFDPELPLVVCYRDEFNQVILNLIVNAAHAIGDVVGNSGNKGTITISTRRDGESAEVRVTDTGKGIPETIRNRIFDPFFTTKPAGKGTGQGLAITHTVIVQHHKGTIALESKEGEGTTFIIRLPIKSSSSDSSENENDSPVI